MNKLLKHSYIYLGAFVALMVIGAGTVQAQDCNSLYLNACFHTGTTQNWDTIGSWSVIDGKLGGYAATGSGSIYQTTYDAPPGTYNLSFDYWLPSGGASYTIQYIIRLDNDQYEYGNVSQTGGATFSTTVTLASTKDIYMLLITPGGEIDNILLQQLGPTDAALMQFDKATTDFAHMFATVFGRLLLLLNAVLITVSFLSALIILTAFVIRNE